MPFRPAVHGVQVKLLMTQNAVKMENVWNIDAGATVTPTILGLVNGVFDAWVTSDYAPNLSNSVKFDQLIATDISVANGAQDIIVPTTAQGGQPGAQAAGNAAFVASLRTASTGKNFRGRTYVPGLINSFVADAQHTSTLYAAAVNTAFTDLITLLNAAGYKLCVLSRFLNNVLRATAILTEVIAVITDTKIDSQQRRTAN